MGRKIEIKMRFLFRTSVLLGIWGAFSIGKLLAQQADLSVFSSAGGSESVPWGGEIVECYWNIGETITETFGTTPDFDASRKRLTQGFEQGEGFIEDPLATIILEEGEDYRAEIYPNPVRQTLYVRLWDESNREYTLSLHNLQGVRLRYVEGLRAGVHSLNMWDLRAGVYLLEVRAGNAVKSFKLIKVS